MTAKSSSRDRAAAPRDFRIPQVPLEWLDAGAWRLPSGKALAEFALQAGFLAPLLLNARGPESGARTFGWPGHRGGWGARREAYAKASGKEGQR